jgi:hypothetical protein
VKGRILAGWAQKSPDHDGKDRGGGWRLGTQGMGGKPMAGKLEDMAWGVGDRDWACGVEGWAKGGVDRWLK